MPSPQYLFDVSIMTGAFIAICSFIIWRAPPQIPGGGNAIEEEESSSSDEEPIIADDEVTTSSDEEPPDADEEGKPSAGDEESSDGVADPPIGNRNNVQPEESKHPQDLVSHSGGRGSIGVEGSTAKTPKGEVRQPIRNHNNEQQDPGAAVQQITEQGACDGEQSTGDEETSADDEESPDGGEEQSNDDGEPSNGDKPSAEDEETSAEKEEPSDDVEEASNEDQEEPISWTGLGETSEGSVNQPIGNLNNEQDYGEEQPMKEEPPATGELPGEAEQPQDLVSQSSGRGLIGVQGSMTAAETLEAEVQPFLKPLEEVTREIAEPWSGGAVVTEHKGNPGIELDYLVFKNWEEPTEEAEQQPQDSDPLQTLTLIRLDQSMAAAETSEGEVSQPTGNRCSEGLIGAEGAVVAMETSEGEVSQPIGNRHSEGLMGVEGTVVAGETSDGEVEQPPPGNHNNPPQQQLMVPEFRFPLPSSMVASLPRPPAVFPLPSMNIGGQIPAAGTGQPGPVVATDGGNLPAPPPPSTDLRRGPPSTIRGPPSCTLRQGSPSPPSDGSNGGGEGPPGTEM